MLMFTGLESPTERHYSLCVIGCIEYAWNVFPSTSLSSALLVASNFLLLVGLWTGYSDDHNAQRDLSALKKGD